MRDRIRYFNKYILNHLTRGLAGLPFGPFALVYHVGRRSGKTYSTPIIVMPVEGGFMVALTYGPNVDWYRNILAAGRCRIRWHQKEYAITAFEPASIEAGAQAFPQPFRFVLKRIGIQHFFKMKM